MIRRLMLLLALGAAAFAARPAAAHAVLLETTPADGAVLPRSPPEAVMRFDEPVRPIAVELLDSKARVVGRIAEGAPRAPDLELPLPAGLAEGTYVVTYRVVSLDSHPVGGSFVFSIGRPGASAAARAAASAAGGAWPLVAAIDRLLLYVGLIGAGGGVLFHVLVARDLARIERGPRLSLRALALLGLAAALAGIGIEGAALAGAGLWGVLDARLWRLGESTSLGLSLTVAAGSLALLALAVETPGRLWLRLLALPAALAGLCSLALTGHALTAGPLWLTGPALASHVLVAAFWLGALAPLWRALGRLAPAAALTLLGRFSAMAIPAVAVLVAAGSMLAILQLGRIGALLDTAYGLRLAAKLVCVVLLLLLAALNRYKLTPALARPGPTAGRGLRLSIGLELALGLAILAATSSLGEAVPPRALAAEARLLAAAPARGFSLVTFTGDKGALIEVTPDKAGRNAVSVHLFAADGAPLEAQEVTLAVAGASTAIEPREQAMVLLAPGHFRAEGAEMPFVGAWSLRLTAIVSDFQEIRFETTVDIK